MVKWHVYFASFGLKFKLLCYLFFLRFASFADKNKVLVGGLFAVYIDPGAMKPSFTGITKNPDHGSIRFVATFFSYSAELYSSLALFHHV